MNVNTIRPHGEMTAAEILECSYQALSIISTCSLALHGINEGNAGTTGGDIAKSLEAALALLGPVHDALECQKA